MQKLVVDSSVIVKWLNQKDEELLEKADKVMSDAQENNVMLLAPELAKYEIGNALHVRKKISLVQAKVTFNNLFMFPIQFVDQSEDLAYKTYKIAQDAKITYYDASFIALAEQENAILITDNIKHQGKHKGISVKSLAEYES